jgi:hypothetical protein
LAGKLLGRLAPRGNLLFKGLIGTIDFSETVLLCLENIEITAAEIRGPAR